MKLVSSVALAFALSACATIPPADIIPAADPTSAKQIGRTKILDAAMAERLRGNSGITLQWIGWDERGNANVATGDNGTWVLRAVQEDESRNAMLVLNGEITEIGSDYFLFDGTVTIRNAPDAGRLCTQDKIWRFGITQSRQYWRLREFEWCDGLTDYIDIYF
ncbi:MAG: hypothetical protein WBA68_09540 [Alteraurantiacibacter sp.]